MLRFGFETTARGETRAAKLVKTSYLSAEFFPLDTFVKDIFANRETGSISGMELQQVFDRREKSGWMDGWMMKGKKNRRDVDIYICLFRYIYTNNLALPSSCSNRWSNFNRFATTLGRIVRNVIRVYRPFVGFPLRICLSAKFRRGTSGLDGVAHSDAIQLLRNPWSATS